MRLLLFSDLHLDMPFLSVPAASARRHRRHLRDTLTRIVDLASNERVDALLCGGDLFEHERIAPDTGEFLRQAFAGLAPVRVILAPGNHDWLAPSSLYRQTAWPANVHVFTGQAFEPLALAEGITLWGMGHQVPAATTNPLRDFKVVGDGVHVALFHGSELGWFDRQGEGKAPHAPFSADDVRLAGLHHAFVGHYHAPQDGEFLTYPGNPDPLTFGESGPRGAVLVTVGADGTIERERRAVAVSQVHDVQVDLSGCGTRQAVRERVAAALADLAGFVRVTVGGELPPAVDFRYDDLVGVGDHLDALTLRVDGLRNAYDVAAIAGEATVRGQFVRDVLEAGLPESERHRVLVTGLRALEGRDDLEVE